jgi:hypothetical protein
MAADGRLETRRGPTGVGPSWSAYRLLIERV